MLPSLSNAAISAFPLLEEALKEMRPSAYFTSEISSLLELEPTFDTQSQSALSIPPIFELFTLLVAKEYSPSE